MGTGAGDVMMLTNALKKLLLTPVGGRGSIHPSQVHMVYASYSKAHIGKQILVDSSCELWIMDC